MQESLTLPTQMEKLPVPTPTNHHHLKSQIFAGESHVLLVPYSIVAWFAPEPVAGFCPVESFQIHLKVSGYENTHA